MTGVLLRPYVERDRTVRDRVPTRPRHFLERGLERLDTWEPEIGAFVTLNIPGARAAADRATARWRAGQAAIADRRHADRHQGCHRDRRYADPVRLAVVRRAGESNKDAACVAALRAAGAVILGKTVTTEFAMSYPRGTRNPHDLQRTPGGSSSGSAAAVAAGIISVGLGTQVIGSVLRPASFCGVVGYKPTVHASQPYRQPRLSEPELHRRPRGESRGYLAGRKRDREPRRRRSRLAWSCRTGSTSPAAQAAAARFCRNSRMARGRRCCKGSGRSGMRAVESGGDRSPDAE